MLLEAALFPALQPATRHRPPIDSGCRPLQSPNQVQLLSLFVAPCHSRSVVISSDWNSFFTYSGGDEMKRRRNLKRGGIMDSSAHLSPALARVWHGSLMRDGGRRSYFLLSPLFFIWDCIITAGLKYCSRRFGVWWVRFQSLKVIEMRPLELQMDVFTSYSSTPLIRLERQLHHFSVLWWKELWHTVYGAL